MKEGGSGEVEPGIGYAAGSWERGFQNWERGGVALGTPAPDFKIKSRGTATVFSGLAETTCLAFQCGELIRYGGCGGQECKVKNRGLIDSKLSTGVEPHVHRRRLKVSTVTGELCSGLPSCRTRHCRTLESGSGAIQFIRESKFGQAAKSKVHSGRESGKLRLFSTGDECHGTQNLTPVRCCGYPAKDAPGRSFIKIPLRR